MISLTAEIDKKTAAELEGFLSFVQNEFPEKMGNMVKRAGLDICRSLKARTRRAPKKQRRKDYRIERTVFYPTISHPIHGTHGKANGWTIHRYALTKRIGSPAEFTRYYGAYAYQRRGKHHKRLNVISEADQKNSILHPQSGPDRLKIARSGLAKKSWGWAAKSIYNGADFQDTSWAMRKRDKRDPRRDVRGSFAEVVTGPAKGAVLDIHNKLDYIEDAMYPGAVSDAVSAAVRGLTHKFEQEIDKRAQRGGFFIGDKRVSLQEFTAGYKNLIDTGSRA